MKQTSLHLRYSPLRINSGSTEGSEGTGSSDSESEDWMEDFMNESDK